MTGKLTSLFCFLLIVCITSCSKKSGPGGNPPPPPPQDSLGAGWQKIIVDTAKKGLQDISFPDNITGYTCGYSNMFKSTDGGLTWKPLAIPAVTQLFNLFFLDSLNGWAIEPTSLIRTSDGGKNWKKISFPGTYYLEDVQFLNPRLGYFVGFNGLFVSTDSGNTWTKTPASFSGNGLFFTDSLHGWVTTGDQILGTVDGGKTFTEQVHGVGNMTIIKFIDAQHGWAIGGGAGLEKTINSGTLWSSTNPHRFEDGDFDFFDANNGFVSETNYIYKTADGGITNIPIVHAPNGAIIEIDFNDIHHGWACNILGYIYRYNQ